MVWEPLDNQRVVFGDCQILMDGLESESVDMIIADPPYDYKSYKAGGSVAPSNSCKDKGKMSYGDKVAVLDYETWMRRCHRILKPGHSMLVFEHPSTMGKLIPAILNSGFRVHWTCVLHVTDRQPVSSLAGGRVWSKHDVMIWCVKGDEPTLFHGWPTPKDVYSSGQVSSLSGPCKGFPGKKPVKLLTQWIQWLSPEGGLVLDPFLGSGSTLKAAWICGRKGLGFEIEEQRRDIITDRLKAGQKRLDLTKWC